MADGRSRRGWWAGLVGLALGALALGLWALWRPDPPAAGVLEANGRIEGDQAAVGAKVGGKIVRLAVREGERVQAGRLIAELASEQARARLDEAEHVLHAAHEQLGEARARVVSAEQVAEAAAVAVTLAGRESRARIGEAEAALGAARADVKDTRVLAPFGGSVLRKLVEPGEVVAAGTPLVSLVDLAGLYAKVYVGEAELGKVKVGDPGRVSTDGFPGRYFAARVSEVSQEAQFTPRDVHMKDERVKLVFAVKLAIENPEGILKPGMPVDALIRWDPEASWREGRE